MRFHILGLSHTKTTREYSCCAFTQKVRLLCKMLTGLGHTVYHYGAEGSDPVSTENVVVLSDSCFQAVYGGHDWRKLGFNLDPDNAAYRQFGAKASKEIAIRYQPGDFVLCPFGLGHKPIADSLKSLNPIVVESGIGYTGVFAKFRVFESYAWMHFHYGKEGRELTPQFYDTVIPNYLDMVDYPFVSKKEDYFIFLGRVNNVHKGAGIASDVCKELGAKLYIAGQGDIPDLVGERLGVLSIEERAKWVGSAKALFAPTYYIEPFGTVVIEAQAYGTPVITTDFGAFSENVAHGFTGFRCRTFDQFVWAAKHISTISPATCREWAETRYSLDAITPMYMEYFNSLATLHNNPKGWYATSDRETGWQYL